MIEVKEILSMLSIGTLTKLKNKCEAYNSYCIDYKQVNAKLGVKTRQKDFAELLEIVMEIIALKQFESEQTQSAPNKSGENNNNVTSTMSESQSTQVESKKKEKKSK